MAENLALASFACLSDTELVQTVAPELVKRLPPVDYLMTAEAKGICLTYEMSRIMGMKEFIVARKSRKPYMVNPVSHSVHSVTTQKEQTLWLDGCDADTIRGKRVALIDDVIATGESLAAIENLAVTTNCPVTAGMPCLPTVHTTITESAILSMPTAKNPRIRASSQLVPLSPLTVITIQALMTITVQVAWA